MTPNARMADHQHFHSILADIMSHFGTKAEDTDASLDIVEYVVKAHLMKIASDALGVARTYNTKVTGLDMLFLLIKDKGKARRYRHFKQIKRQYDKTEMERYNTSDHDKDTFQMSNSYDKLPEPQLHELSSSDIAILLFQRQGTFKEYIDSFIPTTATHTKKAGRSRGSFIKDKSDQKMKSNVILPLDERMVFEFLYFSTIDVIGLVMRNAYYIAMEMEKRKRKAVPYYPTGNDMMSSLIFPPNPSEQSSECLLLDIESYFDRDTYEHPRRSAVTISGCHDESRDYSMPDFFGGKYLKNTTSIQPDHIREAVRRLQPSNRGAVDMLGGGTTRHKRKRGII